MAIVNLIVVQYPTKDKHRHNYASVECKCNPDVELIQDKLIICHNSFDRREILEELGFIRNRAWALMEYKVESDFE